MEKAFYDVQLNFNNLQAEVFLANNFFDPGDVKPTSTKNLHQHAYTEIFFCIDPLEITTPTASFHYENSIVIIPPHIDHYTMRKNVYNFMVKFSVPKGCKKTRYNLLQEYLFGSVINAIPLKEKTLFLLKELQLALQEDLEDTLLKINSLLTIILLDIINAYTTNKNDKGHPVYDRMKYIFTVESIIASEYTQIVTLKDLANRLHLSEKQTSRFIHKAYGKSFSEIINDKRLSVAKNLLLTTDMSVSQVLSFLNFKSESYFFALFKKKYGTTPLIYCKRKKDSDL